MFEEFFAKRIGTPKSAGYKFEKIKQAKQWVREHYPNQKLIDLGVGEPDEMADIEIIEHLYQEAKKPENRFYSDNGILEFQKSAAKYMDKVFKVKNLDPTTEITHAIGSKSALAMLPTCFINAGDITLMPAPSYPVLGTHTKYLGGEVFEMPLDESRGYLPDFSKIPTEISKKAKLLYLNYPNNPTGAVASEAFFREAIAYAQANHVLIVHDAAYAALVYGKTQPLSFLSVPGAKEVGLEIHSLSKSFNMTGWRLGFICGHPELIEIFRFVKDNYDSGQFMAIQKAGALALSHPEITNKIKEKYERRHVRLTEILKEVGFRAVQPKGSFFQYCKIPSRAVNTVFSNAESFCEFLIKELQISAVPWDENGAYVRFSVTFETQQDHEDEIFEEIRRRLSLARFVFE